ncbi:MAG: anti-sigma factor RsbA family regulatory protein [Acidimicrobiales bacterium]
MAFHHEALLYDGVAEYAELLVPRVRAALGGGAVVLVIVPADRLALLRPHLDDHRTPAGDLTFEDMDEVGANPARILPRWQAFLEEHPGRPLFGVGEPASPGPAARLDEAVVHEALLDATLAGAARAVDLTVLCPYDRTTLPTDVLAAAATTHPVVVDAADGPRPSATYAPTAITADQLGPALLPAPTGVRPVRFSASGISDVRHQLRLAVTPLARGRVDDVELATAELLANSVVHGGGAGEIRHWVDGRRLVVEVRDAGRITDPLVGRRRPDPERPGGRGLWIANRLADLVQIRSGAHGTTVRLSFELDPAQGPHGGPGDHGTVDLEA